jgi:hypothetical protein
MYVKNNPTPFLGEIRHEKVHHRQGFTASRWYYGFRRSLLVVQGSRLQQFSYRSLADFPIRSREEIRS